MNFNKEVTELRKYRGTAADFLEQLLNVQILSSGADAGAIVKLSNGGVRVLTISVESEQQPEWLTAGIEQAPQSLRRGEMLFLSLGAGQKHGVFVIPFPDTSRGSLTILTGSPSLNKKLNNGLMGLTFGMLDNFEARMTLKHRQAAQARIHQALDIELTVNRKKDFHSYCLELCNELAAKWNCSRVSLGFIVKDRVRLRFMSHTEKFSHKAPHVHDLEEAMEESADQDRELIFPPIDGARYIYRQLESFSKEHDHTALLAIPFHHASQVEGVLFLERKNDNPFLQDDLETLRLVADLTSPRMLDLERYASWVHKSVELAKSPFKLLMDRQNTLIKLLVLVFVGLIVFLSVVKGDYNLEGSFRMEVTEEKTLAAPYEGILSVVNVKPGDTVKKGDLLAEMDTLDLQLKSQELEAEALNLKTEYTIAVSEGNTAKGQIAKARLKGVNAQKALYSELIRRGKLYAPISGVILSEDLTRLFRAPVSRGDELFIIGDINELAVIAYIPEDQIPDLANDMPGQAALAGHPEDRIEVFVKEIGAVAEVKDQQNVYKVRMTVKEKPEWLRSGMEGLVKVKKSERLLIWIWSRKGINWIRMKFWI